MTVQIRVECEAEVTHTARAAGLIHPSSIRDFGAVKDLADAEWFREECYDLIVDAFDGEWDEVRVKVEVTRPNPAYAGPDVLFGDPPPPTTVETAEMRL